MDAALYSELQGKVIAKTDISNKARAKLQDAAAMFGRCVGDSIGQDRPVAQVIPIGFADGLFRFELNVKFLFGSKILLEVPLNFNVSEEGKYLVFVCEDDGNWKKIEVRDGYVHDQIIRPATELIDSPLRAQVARFADAPLGEVS